MTQAGGPSLVNVGSLYVEAAGGGAGSAGSHGSTVTGASSGTVGTLVGGGAGGASGGASGSRIVGNAGVPYGTGGGSTPAAGSDGVVILEWVV